MLKNLALSLVGAVAIVTLCAAPVAIAQTVAVAAKPAAKAAAPAAAPAPAKAKVSTPVKAAAAGAAAAAVVALSAGQLDAAQRVYTGTAACEFGETISLTAQQGKPGHFTLTHKKASYTLVPEETTTGAVRLEDKRAGIVWLQIPSKSMLMNSKIGQRVADNCLMAEQKS
jgi:hypothetical protein